MEQGLGDDFREHLIKVRHNDKHACKAAHKHYNFPHHSWENIIVFGIPFRECNNKSDRNSEEVF